MFRWKTSLLIALLAAAAIGQTPQIESADVDRVGAHIACQCGGCKESVSCPMAKRGCGFCVPAKARIYKMQKAGLSDQAIIDVYKKEFGDKVFMADPSPFFWIVPSFMIILGIGVIFLFVRRYSQRPRVLASIPAEPSFDRYREQIERETARLE
jgi:cytochrome c-type biogenesis protein CcmH/NrfF